MKQTLGLILLWTGLVSGCANNSENTQPANSSIIKSSYYDHKELHRAVVSLPSD